MIEHFQDCEAGGILNLDSLGRRFAKFTLTKRAFQDSATLEELLGSFVLLFET